MSVALVGTKLVGSCQRDGTGTNAVTDLNWGAARFLTPPLETGAVRKNPCGWAQFAVLSRSGGFQF